MAEISPGVSSCDLVLKPPPGYFTATSIRRKLCLEPWEFWAHVKALGIVLTPFVRDDGIVRRVYKKRWRWLTAEEAGRIMERVYMLRGRRIE